ncbi:hypothetical protein [Chamaesiphon sp.]|uniref:hypothetical protein n=1 Tax=Chamaesiphon sp. TaxID=2814140 RepID=UPI0035948AC6
MKVTFTQNIEITIEGSPKELANILNRHKNSLTPLLNSMGNTIGLTIGFDADYYELGEIIDEKGYLYEWEYDRLEGTGGGEGRFIISDDAGNRADDEPPSW